MPSVISRTNSDAVALVGRYAKESRELEKRVDAAGDDHLQSGRLRDLPHARDVATEAGGGRIDDRADSGFAHARQLDDRIVSALALIPVQRAEHVARVLKRLWVHHEDVLSASACDRGRPTPLGR